MGGGGVNYCKCHIALDSFVFISLNRFICLLGFTTIISSPVVDLVVGCGVEDERHLSDSENLLAA